ncbi:MAG: hypothetical protein N4A49_09375 [Marinifilaceae bacterium]|jgi:hypothetical protein|nr:hypothetical protein [Marinifilaceae bacterium]
MSEYQIRESENPQNTTLNQTALDITCKIEAIIQHNIKNNINEDFNKSYYNNIHADRRDDAYSSFFNQYNVEYINNTFEQIQDINSRNKNYNICRISIINNKKSSALELYNYMNNTDILNQITYTERPQSLSNKFLNFIASLCQKR